MKLIIGGSVLFLIIIAAVFFLTYKLGQNTTDTNQQLINASRESVNNYQQIRRIKLTHKDTQESMEIYMDGTVKYYDKSGKLIKQGRRGFAETQKLFRQYEWLINNGKDIQGGDYYIEIETQKGTTTYNPGDNNTGNSLINDTVDFVNNTVNPTPTPQPSIRPSSTPLFTPLPTPTPSPTPLPDKPDYLNAPPFKCSDYYRTGGKPLKISDTYCGIE